MIKRFFKAIGLITIFGISLCSLYLANLFLMKPFSVDHKLIPKIVIKPIALKNL